MKKILLAFSLIAISLSSECMQRGRSVVGGVDWDFFQEQWNKQKVAMNLEEAFRERVNGTPVQWEALAEKTAQIAKKSPQKHAIDVESAYGGGDQFNAEVVCEQALSGDKVAQYSLYRHIKYNDWVAYMLLAISAVFGRFTDSIEEAKDLGLKLNDDESFKSLEEKVSKIVSY